MLKNSTGIAFAFIHTTMQSTAVSGIYDQLLSKSFNHL